MSPRTWAISLYNKLIHVHAVDSHVICIKCRLLEVVGTVRLYGFDGTLCHTKKLHQIHPVGKIMPSLSCCSCVGGSGERCTLKGDVWEHAGSSIVAQQVHEPSTLS